MELDLLEKQIQYPLLFPKETERRPRSTIYWNHKQFPKTALMSIIVAIDAVAASTDANGNQSSFISIVHTFEAAFNIMLPNPYKMRDELLSQGDNRTKFLKQMLRALGA